MRFFIALGELLSVSYAQGDDTLARVLQKGVLRVAGDIRTMPWYGYEPIGGDFTGFEYDFIRAIAKKISPELKVEIVPAAWERLPSVVRNGRADVVFNGWFPPEKEQRNANDAWSDCYFHTGHGVLYSAKLKKEPVVDDLKKGRVVIFSDEEAVKVMKELGVERYSKSNEDFKFGDLLLENKADFIVYDMVSIKYLAKKSEGRLVASRNALAGTEGCYAAMTRASAQSLLAAINKGIRETAEERATILKRYGLQ